MTRRELDSLTVVQAGDVVEIRNSSGTVGSFPDRDAAYAEVRRLRGVTLPAEDETVPCSTCSAQVSPLAVFPGGICVECYAKTPEASAPLTDPSVVAAMFRGSVRS
jgi:hypothetical protein